MGWFYDAAAEIPRNAGGPSSWCGLYQIQGHCTLCITYASPKGSAGSREEDERALLLVTCRGIRIA